MKRHSLATALLLASSLAAPLAARAQCVECATQMLNATLTANSWYNINQTQIDDNRRRDARNGVCYDDNRRFGGCEGTAGRSASQSERFDGGLPDWTAREAAQQVSDTLKDEYGRRLRSQGRGAAAQWLNTASGDIGRQMAALTPEFFRRWDAGDRNSADRWYLEQVRQMAGRYIGSHQGPGVGEAMIGSIPAATRQRAEDATFAVLEPEINRIERTQGQASAIAWARDMGAAVGAGVRNLAPEYALRAKAEGPARAGQWYVDQARSLARLQVASSR